MRLVFVDTWAWYALSSRRDNDHRAAGATLDALKISGAKLLTTNYVLAEATTLIRYRLNHAAVAFRQMIHQLVIDGLLTLTRISESHETEAGEIFDQYREMDLSFADCTSFVLMREQGVTEAFTGDHHFAAMGFSLIPM